MLFLLSSFVAHAGLTSVCEPQQDLGSFVSYIDKVSSEGDVGGAGPARDFYNEVKATLKSGNASNSYLDFLNPSKFKFNWACSGPCSYESESVFIKLQHGVKVTANDVYKSTNKYLIGASKGRTDSELYVGLRKDIKFEGYYNESKIPAATAAAVDDILNEAKRTGKPFTTEKLQSIPGAVAFGGARKDVRLLVNELARNPKKPFIVNMNAFNEKGEIISGHSINVIVEGNALEPSAKLLIINSGEIETSFLLKDITADKFKSALIKTFGYEDGKVKDISFSTFRA